MALPLRRIVTNRTLPGCTLALGLLMSACDQSFAPIAESDSHFSIFGYLDVSAQTQWFRVMPMRPLILTSSEPLDAVIALEQVESGHTVLLRDSVMAFHDRNSEIATEPVFVHNFWTDHPVEPGATYRLIVTRYDGVVSEAMMVTPRDFPEVVVGLMPPVPDDPTPRERTPDYIRLPGVEHLAFVHILYHLRSDCIADASNTIFKGAAAIPEPRSDGYVIPVWRLVTPNLFACDLRSKPPARKVEFQIIASGAAWPSIGSNPSAPALHTRAPNLTNAVGFAGGVLTKLVPYETCILFNVPQSPFFPPPHCELTYNSETVSIRGTIRDAGCRDIPLADAQIRLTEIVPASQPARHRPVWTDDDGLYEISGIQPGLDHALEVWHEARVGPGGGFVFEAYVDTLSFSPGEEMTLDVGLRRPALC